MVRRYKLSRGSLRALRERVPRARRPRARWRAIVRLVAHERGWTNADAFLGVRYQDCLELFQLGIVSSPFMRALEEAARAG